MFHDVVVYLGCGILLLGAAFSLIAAIGVIRLPDLLSRMHAASKAGAVGGGLVFLAVALLAFDVAIAVRAVIGIVFLLLTTPISAHLLARISHGSTVTSGQAMVLDELKSKTAHTSPSGL
jgi:multicomponent Na+:H+ antiporter subunit G